MMRKTLQLLGENFLDPLPLSRQRHFEVLFCSSFFLYFLSRFITYREWLTGEGFHYTPDIHLMSQFTPFLPLQEWMAWVLAGAAFAGALGSWFVKWRRFAFLILLPVAVYIQGVDISAAFALNKLYIVGLAILVCSPPLIADAGGKKMLGSAWAFRVLQATILLQIFHAGLAKVLHGNWLEHSDVIWSHAQGLYRTEIAAFLLRELPMWGWTVLQWGALSFELLGPFALIFRKTRWLGLLGGLGFVSFITLAMNDLLFFMLQVAAYLSLFVDPEWFRWKRHSKA